MCTLTDMNILLELYIILQLINVWAYLVCQHAEKRWKQGCEPLAIEIRIILILPLYFTKTNAHMLSKGLWCVDLVWFIALTFCRYQEILTDPSYAGQFVLMTNPHIGNTGVNFGGWIFSSISFFFLFHNHMLKSLPNLNFYNPLLLQMMKNQNSASLQV